MGPSDMPDDMPPRCCACSSSEASRLESHRDAVAGRDYSIWRCVRCELVFCEPLLFPGREWYEKFNYIEGYGEFGGGGDEKRFARLLDLLPARGGRLLDIGCAAGLFLKRALERGFLAEGLEVDPRFIDLARRSGVGAPIRCGVLDDAFASAHEGGYDVVCLLETLEHLDDLARALDRVRRLLTPGGYFLVSVPDNRRPTPFGRDLWDYPPHHLTRWTPKALRAFIERGGFDVAALEANALPVWEFSRIWADRSAAWLLRQVKTLVFGSASARRPMDELTGERSSGLPAARPAARLMPAKSLRLRLVSAYHLLFHVTTFPAFLALKLFYVLRDPSAGVNLLMVARKRP